MKTIKVIKKDGAKQLWDPLKIKRAAQKSADRVSVTLTDADFDLLINKVVDKVEYYTNGADEISVAKIHDFVEEALELVNFKVAESYRNYRNFKLEFAGIMNTVANEAERIMYRGDKENSNKDSSLVSTQGALIKSALSKEMYKKQFLTDKERELENIGLIYIHDEDSRMFSANCCLFRIDEVLKGGFEMGNIFYNEPKSLDVAFDVIGDIVLSAAAQQYGGFTIPSVDFILEPYAQKTYDRTYKERLSEFKNLGIENEVAESAAKKLAMKQVEAEFKQGFQGWEIKFNTVASSRGDYPFITVSSGLNVSEFGRMCNVIMFNVHKNGQGAPGLKRPVLFPKYVYLYEESTNGPKSDAKEIFQAALDCSAKTMYPDWLSLSGVGYVPNVYRGNLNGTKFKPGSIVAPMGCRAFLSPYYERGGFEPADENDVFVTNGRFNAGAISINFPLVYLHAKATNREFMELLDEILEDIRKIHIRTRDFLAEKRASTNPLGYCEGGFWGFNLRPEQKLKEAPGFEATTYSFGITALNELQRAYNNKSIAEDGAFALEVLQHVNRKVAEFKTQDHILYAIYGTPAESLVGKIIIQIRNYTKRNYLALKEAGYEIIETDNGNFVIPNISDKEYVSNSFHCHVSEELSPIQKQDLEGRFWDLCNGGKIQYVRYPVGYNKEAMKTLVLRAMNLGFYEGVNLALNYCDDCGYEEVDMACSCPKCGSKNITKIDRMNGYLSYSRVKGDSRLNDAKMAEIKDRKSM